MKLQFLINRNFSANAQWRLVEKSCLNQPELSALADILADEQIFGIFKPTDKKKSISPKIAYKDVALLFYYLQQPSALPAFIKAIYDDETNAMIAKLVSEEILCIKTEEGWLSGAEAGKYLFKENENTATTGDGLITQLSNKAITYAIQLKNVDQSFLSTAIYMYNTLPVMPQHYISNVEKFLGIGFNTALETTLLNHWSKQLPTKEYNWIMWNRKDNSGLHPKNTSTYKLYISPALSCFPEVFEKTALLLSATKAKGFKTGADHQGMTRPDRFVIYFSLYSEMKAAAYLLNDALKEYPAHGVPFTATFNKKGIISWGIDPPAEDVIHQLEGGSWRAGIAERISSAIMQANASNLSKKASIDFVHQKLITEGVDPITWAPQYLKQDFN